MKIVLVTVGSRGDVQPMLALSLALQKEGHNVLLVGPPEKAEWAGEYECPFHPLGNNLTAFIDSMSRVHTTGAALGFVAYMYKEMMAQFDVLPQIITGADLVVGASLTFALSSVSEHLGIPYRFIAFCPQILPSGYHPFPAFKTQKLPQWYNRMTWWFRRNIDRFGLTRMLNKRRRNLGLKPVKDAWVNVLGTHVITASDKEIVKIPEDLEIQATQTGYLHFHQAEVHDSALERFLESGPPPLYAGFGSMPKPDQTKNVATIVEAARMASQRVVINKFWDEPSEYTDAEDVFFIKGYPHLDLFPRMSAVIHHGGAGTTATTAISGVPQIIVPHILDQYYWGYHIFQSGLGPRPIWRARLTSQRLASAISECLSNEQFRMRAELVSMQIKKRNSLSVTVQEILKTQDLPLFT
jgi:UDP:flavonoid glycosyltransferase YjiC (YdhE family)